MNKGWRKAVLFTVCASLTATTLAGCSKKEEDTLDPDAVVMTVGDEEVPLGLLNFAAHFEQAETQYMYDMYFGEDSVSYEYSEGYTIGDMIRIDAVSVVENMILARQNMDDYGVSLTDEEEAAIKEAAASFIADNDAEVLELMSATEDIVTEYLQLYTIYERMQEVIGDEVDTEVSDEEAAQRRAKYVLVPAQTEDEDEEEEAVAEEESEPVTEEVQTEAETAVLEENDAEKTQSADEEETEEIGEEEEAETEDPETAAAMAEAYEKAGQIIALIEGGMDFDDAVAEIDDSLNVYENTFGEDSTVISEGIVEATNGLPDDTLVTEPVEAASGYYVVYVVSELDREATDEEKESIIEDRKTEHIEDEFYIFADQTGVTTDDDVLAQIQFNFNLDAYTDLGEEESESEVIEDETGIIEEEEPVTEFTETELATE